MPRLRSLVLNSSYSVAASSGGAAAMKLGRRWPRALPYSVNCDTTSAAPLTSSSERFIFPASSSKMRRFATFSAIDAATEEESSLPRPSNIISPASISPVTRPSTVTFARLTRCTTTRIYFDPGGATPPLFSWAACVARVPEAAQRCTQRPQAPAHLRLDRPTGFDREGRPVNGASCRNFRCLAHTKNRELLHRRTARDRILPRYASWVHSGR